MKYQESLGELLTTATQSLHYLQVVKCYGNTPSNSLFAHETLDYFLDSTNYDYHVVKYICIILFFTYQGGFKPPYKWNKKEISEPNRSMRYQEEIDKI